MAKKENETIIGGLWENLRNFRIINILNFGYGIRKVKIGEARTEVIYMRKESEGLMGQMIRRTYGDVGTRVFFVGYK